MVNIYGPPYSALAVPVPSLDLSRFVEGSEEDSKEFCSRLIAAFRHYGFVTIFNHGIDDATLQNLFSWNRKFYSLPLDDKMKAAHPPKANPHRGYSYVGQEKLSVVRDYEKGNSDGKEVVLDIKESFDQGPPNDDMYPNRWVEESALPGFRAFMELFYSRCEQIHLKLLQCIEIGLGLDVGTLREKCLVNTSELRLNHYPSCDAKEIHDGVANRISEHTDFGTLTLLFQDNVGGLEIEDQSHFGTYVPLIKSVTT